MKKFVVCVFVIVFVVFGIFEIQHRVRKDDVPVDLQAKEEKVIEEDKTINMTVTGDVLCHNTNFWDAYDANSDSYDFSYTFEDIKKYFDSSDIAIGTLECNFAGKEVRL